MNEREGESAFSAPHKEGSEVNPAALSPTKSSSIQTEATASPRTSSQKDVMAEKAQKQLLDSSSQ